MREKSDALAKVDVGVGVDRRVTRGDCRSGSAAFPRETALQCLPVCVLSIVVCQQSVGGGIGEK